MRHMLINALHQEHLSEQGGNANSSPVPDVIWVHPEGQPWNHSAQSSRKIDFYEVITNPSLGNEGDFHHVETTCSKDR